MQRHYEQLFQFVIARRCKVLGLQRKTQRTLSPLQSALQSPPKKPFATAFATAETRLSVTIREPKMFDGHLGAYPEIEF
jgi:hypothetical protein